MNKSLNNISDILTIERLDFENRLHITRIELLLTRTVQNNVERASQEGNNTYAVRYTALALQAALSQLKITGLDRLYLQQQKRGNTKDGQPLGFSDEANSILEEVKSILKQESEE